MYSEIKCAGGWMILPQELSDDIIDIAEGIALIGDRDTYLSIVNDYIAQTEYILLEMDAACSQDDVNLLLLKAHSLKGTSGSLFIHGMKTVGAELESAAGKQDRAVLPALVKKAKDEFDRLQRHLEFNLPVHWA